MKEIFNSIWVYMTQTFWELVRTGNVTDDIAGPFVGAFFVYLVGGIIFCAAVGGAISNTRSAMRNLWKPVRIKLNQGLISFGFQEIYIPYCRDITCSVEEEYNSILQSTKKGCALHQETYNALMKEANDTIIRRLGRMTRGLYNAYMHNRLYLDLIMKRNIDGTHEPYVRRNESIYSCGRTLVLKERFFKPIKHGLFKNLSVMDAMNFGCALLKCVIVCEICSLEDGNDIIKGVHDTEMWCSKYNDVLLKMSKHIPIVCFKVAQPNPDGKWMTKTTDGRLYKSKMWAQFIFDEKVIPLVDREDDVTCKASELENFFDYFGIRETLINMIGTDSFVERKTVFDQDEYTDRGRNVILHKIDSDTFVSIDNVAKGKGKKVTIHYFESINTALDLGLLDKKVKHNDVAVITTDGEMAMFRIIKPYNLTEHSSDR